MNIRKQLTRRRVLGAAAASVAGLGLYAWRIEPHWLTVVHRPLPIAGAPSQWIGRRIVQISDIHVGTLVDSDYLIASLQRVNELKPDLILITGDFMSCWNREVPMAEVGRVMKHLDRPPQGVVGILGNHDYGGAEWNNEAIADELVETLKPLGIEVLRNQTVDRDGLAIIGLDELWCVKFDLRPVKEDLKKSVAKIALVHNPDACDHPGWRDYKGWIFCGHTHGGQCKSPFLPPLILPVNNRRYTSGVIDLEDGRTVHINPGMGYIKRIRFNVRPEITVFEVTA